MNYALLIHGPYSEQWLDKITNSIINFKKTFNQIILVSYEHDLENYKQLINSLNMNDKINIVTVKDLINPGYFNINRQLLCVKRGLAEIKECSYIFKLRNDQCVNFNKLLKYISEDKIITTNCFTRKDRLYHPSDMFLAGKKELLNKVYSMPYRENTHLMDITECKIMYRDNPKLKFLPLAPESLLCKHYLKENNWELKNTEIDSYNAIKKFYTVVNSWNIDYKWHKKRTPFCPNDFLIIPHYFKIKPFEDVMSENAKCYLETDFSGKLLSVKDLFFVCLAKCIWAFWQNNENCFYNFCFKKFNSMSRNVRYKLLKLLPYFLVKREVERLKTKIKQK